MNAIIGRARQELGMRTLGATRGAHSTSPLCLVVPLAPEDPTMELSKAPSWAQGDYSPHTVPLETQGLFSLK